jgi:DNA-binding NtrC family response regulator
MFDLTMNVPLQATQLIRGAGEADQLLVQEASLTVVAGPDKGSELPIAERTIVVGTSLDCDLVLTDGAVSRRHFEVRATPEGFFVRDLASTNGTFLGKLRLGEAHVSEATLLRVGRSEIKLVIGSKQERLELSRHERFGSMLGKSPVMRRCFALLEAAAACDATVLIEGESGTGKEIAAETVHQLSERARGPFVVVDCGAIASNLIESELFGHEKGAFTGATAAHSGAFEQADGGTLFLDEIGELEISMQPKLLRFLEKREVRRVGGTAVRKVDVRIIAATNRRLESMAKQGSFREDLFYRLAVICVALPPLRQRREDVPVLALELARRIRPGLDPVTWLDERAREVLSSYAWPGNVRELRNVIERLAALPEFHPELLLKPPVSNLGGEGVAEGSMGAVRSDALAGLDTLSYHDAKERILDAFERRYVAAVLAREEGVVARAAEQAGVPRQTFFRLIAKHDLRGRASRTA